MKIKLKLTLGLCLLVGIVLLIGCITQEATPQPTGLSDAEKEMDTPQPTGPPSDAEKEIDTLMAEYQNIHSDMKYGVLIHEASFQWISEFSDSDRQKAIELSKEMGLDLIKIQNYPWQYTEDELKTLDKFVADVKASGMMISMCSYGIDWKYFGTIPIVTRGKADWETLSSDHIKWTKYLIERYHPDIIEICTEPAWFEWTLVKRSVSDQEWYDLISDVANAAKGIDPSITVLVPLCIKDASDPFSDNELAKMLITNPPEDLDIVGLDFFDPYELGEVDDLAQIRKKDKKIDLWIFDAVLIHDEFNNAKSEHVREKWLKATTGWAQHNELGGYVIAFLREPDNTDYLGAPVHEFVNDDWSKKEIFFVYQRIIKGNYV